MTDERIANLFSMQRDATIGVRDGSMVFFNASARGQFPNLTIGDEATQLLPPAVLEMEDTDFSASITVENAPYTVLGTRMDGLCVYTLIPQETEADQASDQLLERVTGTMRRTLTVLNMATETLMPVVNQMDEPKQGANLTIINKTYYQLQRLCDNLDHHFRLGAGQARLCLEELDFVSFCRDLTQSTDHFAKRLSHRVHFQADFPHLIAAIDKQKMTKLILNLVSNSLKHLKADGSLTLTLTQSGEDAVLTLRDTGTGIEPSHIGEIFTQYQAKRSDTDITAGVGLGLNIAQEIARLHGGTLFVTSTPDRGTAVRLRVPIRQEKDSGVLTEVSLPYGEGDDGMHLILTELADILDDEAFGGRYY